MALDTHKNFARSTLAAGIAAGATSFSVATGEGAKFDAGAQWITIWDSTTYSCADLDPNREIVRVSSRATDTFTVSLRGQRGTSDVNHNTGGKTYTVQQTLCGEDFDGMMENVLTTRGDVVVRNATTPARLAIGGFGTYFSTDGVDPEWAAPQNFFRLFDDFIAGDSLYPGDTIWTTATISGTISAGVGEPGHPGIVVLSTSSSAGSFPQIAKTGGGMLFGGGKLVYRTAVKLSNLSTGTETFTVKVGIFDAYSMRDGVWFEYTHSVNSGNWQGQTCKAFTQNSVNGTVAASTNWQILEFVVNAAGTNVDFYVDGTLIGSSTTNIPVAAGDETGLHYAIGKSAGTTARTLSIDYCLVTLKLTTAR